MRRCENCKVDVRGVALRCPLCQSELTGKGSPEDEPFPQLAGAAMLPIKVFLRVMAFLSIAAVVICLAIGVVMPAWASWTFYVTVALGCMWVCLWTLLLRRHNPPKSVLWLVFIISLLSVLWDYLTGWHRWSLDFVIPSLCVFGLIVVVVMAKLFKQKLADYLVYLIINSIFGVVPALFVWLNWSRVIYPSVICAAASALSLAALFLFEWLPMKDEVKKRLHL